MDPFISAAREDHERFAMLARMGFAGDAIMILAEPGTHRVVEVSPAAERFYGWSREEFLTKRIDDYATSGQQAIRAGFADDMDGEFHIYITRHKTSSGELRDVEIHMRSVEVGEKSYALATIFDLREQQRAKAAMEASEERYRQFVEVAPDGLFVSIGDTFVYANPAGAQLLGVPDSSELLGHNVFEFIHPDDRGKIVHDMRDFSAGKTAAAASSGRLRRLDGTEVFVELRAVAVEYDGRRGGQIIARDITDRVRLEAVRAWITAIVESSDDAIYSEDVEGFVLNWNEGAERTYGFRANEIIGKNVYDTLIPEHLAEENRERLRRMWKDDRPARFDTVRLNRDGQPIDVAVTLSPMHNSAGDIVGISAIGHDISERKQLEQAKDEFLSLVSHELRTPLTTILGYAQLLSDVTREFDLEQRVQIGDKLHERAKDMVALVEELLDATRLRTGELHLQMNSVDATRLLAVLVESFPDSDRMRCRLDEDRIGPVVRCDPRWLSIAVGNLVANALKFSPAHEPVFIEVERNGDNVMFHVHDRGPGVDPATVEQMFDRFVQGDMSSTRAHDGAGLGLYIARRVAEMHGGTAAGEPREGGGSTFTIHIPRG